MPPEHGSLKDLISRCAVVDAHTHSDRYDDRDVLIRSVERNRILTLSSSTDPASIKTSFRLHKECPWILSAAGIHPWNAGQYGPDDILKLEEFYARAHQISEIGMDRLWAPEEASEKKQTEILDLQLSLAEKYAKPVTLHTKDAEDQVVALLHRYSPPSVLVHWFDGSDRQLKAFLDLGCLFTIPPAVINRDRIKEIIRIIPLHRLLPETDNPPTWPWLFDEPPRADQIFSVLEAASAVLNHPAEELAEIFRKTAATFLGLSG